MGIFDFFRKKKAEEIKKTSFEELLSLTKEEIKNLNEKSLNFKNEIKRDVNEFFSDINEKIPGLKAINLEKRKEEEALKKIVLQNLFSYVVFLERMIQELDKIEDEDTECYIKRIQGIFNGFIKISKMSYERATILIGKELGEVKELIKKFTKEFNEKVEQNKIVFERIKLIKDFKKTLNELEDAKIIQKKFENSIEDIKNKIIEIEKEKQLSEKDYEKYKKSEEYEYFFKEQENIKQENKIFDEKILKLKQEMNLKLLSKQFHNDLKKNKLIKNYNENFLQALKRDENLEIISIIKEANLKVNEEEIKQIRNKISESIKLTENKKLLDFEDKIKKLKYELINEKEKISNEENKIKRTKEKQKQLLEQIKKKAEEIWSNIKLEF